MDGRPPSGASLLVGYARHCGTAESWLKRLAYFAYGDHYVVADLYVGAEGDGYWRERLAADPDVWVEVGGESFTARARQPAGRELDKLRQRWLEDFWHGKRFAAIERVTRREIPIAVLDRDDSYQRKRALNSKIIEEFRSSGGKVSHITHDGLSLATIPLLLLHHRGRKTGRERVNPLQYREYRGGFVVVATNGGSPWHPDWYLNLLATPDTVVEVGTVIIAVRARTAEGEERSGLTREGTAPSTTRRGRYGGYQAFIGRDVPVVVLERRRHVP